MPVANAVAKAGPAVAIAEAFALTVSVPALDMNCVAVAAEALWNIPPRNSEGITARVGEGGRRSSHSRPRSRRP